MISQISELVRDLKDFGLIFKPSPEVAAARIARRQGLTQDKKVEYIAKLEGLVAKLRMRHTKRAKERLAEVEAELNVLRAWEIIK